MEMDSSGCLCRRNGNSEGAVEQIGIFLSIFRSIQVYGSEQHHLKSLTLMGSTPGTCLPCALAGQGLGEGNRTNDTKR